MINDNESKETQFPACHLTACCKRILRTLKRNNSIDIKKKKKLLNKQDCYISFYEGSRLMIDIHT